MKIFKHLLISTLCFALISAILLPDALKLSHVFLEHDHIVCNEHSKTHFHKLDIDCQFFKNKVNNELQFTSQEYIIVPIQVPSKQNFNFYIFLPQYQSLYFSLRGPPSFS